MAVRLQFILALSKARFLYYIAFLNKISNLNREMTLSSKLCPKIILEGTRLTFKTGIAFALNEHPQIVGPRRYRYHSPLISAEWCAFTNYPWGRGLINSEPQEAALAMETYDTWVRLFELQKILFMDCGSLLHFHTHVSINE
jgi:hypothetical protein